MAFSKKRWKKRIAEYPGRRMLTPTTTQNVYDVSRAEGSIDQEGDGFTSENMNDLEDRIEDGFSDAKPFYGPYENFPEIGNPDRIYIDNTVDPHLMYTWDPATQTYILTGGAGGADGSSIDIPITLQADAWTGDTAPYSQTITVPQMRESMTPLFYLSSTGPDAEYAYSLITGYTTAYAEITFYAADLPTVDLSLTLKGIPAQEMEYVDNTIVVIVEPSSFALSTDPDYDGRYVATIPVEGIQAGVGGGWDIVRSGPVLSEAESKIALSITDVKCLGGSVEIVALEVPAQRFLMSLQGTYAGAGDGDIILSGMQEWFDRVEALEEENSKVLSLSVDDVLQDYEDNMTVEFSTIKKQGKILSVYMVFTLTENAQTKIGSLKQGYLPETTYVIASVKGNDIPYAEAGSLWLYEFGDITRYGLVTGEKYYTYFLYAIA